jgi:hypothetical protein
LHLLKKKISYETRSKINLIDTGNLEFSVFGSGTEDEKEIKRREALCPSTV